ncbi:hypothetical protein XENOCAPTIV_000435 [Xenoophorus captivus]|uniref:Uncharacterized protein n=1 Tax=Xenoophorus captivus TaxID=1517983 RepID=A0ABV0QFK9_9TELE
MEKKKEQKNKIKAKIMSLSQIMYIKDELIHVEGKANKSFSHGTQDVRLQKRRGPMSIITKSRLIITSDLICKNDGHGQKYKVIKQMGKKHYKIKTRLNQSFVKIEA